MRIVEEDVFEAVRRGYSSLEQASNETILEYFASVDTEAVRGHSNHVKGILFEQIYVDALNDTGIEASTFDATNHPVTDVAIVDEFGSVSELQLKATDNASYISSTMGMDPGVSFAVTSEIAGELPAHYEVIDTGIENAALERSVQETLFEESVSPIGSLAIFRYLIGIPF